MGGCCFFDVFFIPFQFSNIPLDKNANNAQTKILYTIIIKYSP